jgi:hypothetical protein
MPFSFTLLSPAALLIIITGVVMVNLFRKVFGQHNGHTD